MLSKIPVFDQNIDSVEQVILYLKEIYGRIAGGNFIKHIVVDIGDWDMDTNATVHVDYKKTLGAISYKRILGVDVQIFKDDMTESYGGDITWKVDSTTTKVTLTRPSFYDSTNFNSTISTDATFKTRGRVTLCLVA